MIRKIRNSLSAKVFLMTAVLMAACCSITYFCITQFAPYIYTHDFSAINEELPYFVEDISRFTKEEALFVIEDYCNQIVEKNDDEFVFRLFQSNSEELKQFNKNDTSQWCRLTFTDSTAFFEGLWEEWLNTKLYLLAKGTPMLEKGCTGILEA